MSPFTEPSNCLFNPTKNAPSSATGSTPCPSVGAMTALAVASAPAPFCGELDETNLLPLTRVSVLWEPKPNNEII